MSALSRIHKETYFILQLVSLYWSHPVPSSFPVSHRKTCDATWWYFYAGEGRSSICPVLHSYCIYVGSPSPLPGKNCDALKCTRQFLEWTYLLLQFLYPCVGFRGRCRPCVTRSASYWVRATGGGSLLRGRLPWSR